MKQEQNKENKNIQKDLTYHGLDGTKIEDPTPHTLGQEKWEEELHDIWFEISTWIDHPENTEGQYSDECEKKLKSLISKSLLLQREEWVKEIKKKLQIHCLDYCMQQNGRADCKNCGLSQELLDEILIKEE